MKTKVTFMESKSQLLAGYGLPQCTPVRIYHTGGFVETVKAGSKPEYGKGGFEVLVYSQGGHMIEFRRKDAADDDQNPDEMHHVDVKIPGLTIVSFYEDEEPPPPPEPPTRLDEVLNLLKELTKSLEKAKSACDEARAIIAEMCIDALVVKLYAGVEEDDDQEDG